MIWAFGAFSGGGFGGMGGGGAATQGALTRSELNEGFTMNNIERQIQGVQNGLCDGFYATQTGLMNLGSQMQNCCCETNRNVDAVRYENAKNTCDIITSGNLNTRDIIESQNFGFQRVIDTMTQDKIDSLRSELQSAQLALSNAAQTQNLVNELRPCAKPAYITCSPFTAMNNGQGCCGC